MSVLDMPPHSLSQTKCQITDRTRERLRVSMHDDHMFFQLMGRRKRLTALTAMKWLFAGVTASVGLQRRQLSESHTAQLATEWFFSGMNQLVDREVADSAESSAARFADEMSLFRVSLRVLL